MFANKLLALTALTVVGMSVSIAAGTAATVGLGCSVETSFSAIISEQPAPTASGGIGGTCNDIPTFKDGKQFFFGEGDLGTTIQNEEGVLTIGGSGNSDPFIAFAISAVDIGGPTTFTVVITIPIVPLVGAYSVSASLGISVTDGGTDGASASPSAGNTEIMLNDVGTCVAGVDIGTLVTAPPGGTNTLNFSAGLLPAPVGLGCDTTMTVTVSFLGTGGNDNYAITGRFDLNPVPAPASLALFGAALLGLVGMGRRRAA